MARRRAAAIVVVLAAVLAGCTATPLTMSGPPEPWAVVEAEAVDPIDAYVDARLHAMTLEQKIASLLMVHVGGTDAGPIRATIDATGVAGVIYMGDNVASAE